jgi:hypothetical protein
MRLLICTALLLSVSAYGQSLKDQEDNVVSWQRFNLLTDLQFLEADAAKLDKPLARASAKVSIADAALPPKRLYRSGKHIEGLSPGRIAME